MKRMKKQHLILLAVVFAFMGALLMASCAQSNSSAASSAEASASAEAASSAEASASAEAASSADAQASSTAAASAAADDGEFKGIPTTIPADHVGRTSDQCPTCHVEDGPAPAIPESHFVDGELDVNRLQCFTCHLMAS